MRSRLVTRLVALALVPAMLSTSSGYPEWRLSETSAVQNFGDRNSINNYLSPPLRTAATLDGRLFGQPPFLPFGSQALAPSELLVHRVMNAALFPIRQTLGRLALWQYRTARSQAVRSLTQKNISAITRFFTLTLEVGARNWL